MSRSAAYRYERGRSSSSFVNFDDQDSSDVDMFLLNPGDDDSACSFADDFSPLASGGRPSPRRRRFGGPDEESDAVNVGDGPPGALLGGGGGAAASPARMRRRGPPTTESIAFEDFLDPNRRSSYMDATVASEAARRSKADTGSGGGSASAKDNNAQLGAAAKESGDVGRAVIRYVGVIFSILPLEVFSLPS